MNDLPAPLTPADCDLRGNEWMPLHGTKLFGSRFYSLARRDPRAGLAGIKLWWEAWMQCPAASLPSDDFDLCSLAGFGEDLKAWAKVKDVALHGFVLCSDGRLYHKMLAEEAIVAYAKRLKADQKRELDAERLRQWRSKREAERGGNGGGNGGGNTNDTPDATPDETHNVTPLKRVSSLVDRTGQDRTVHPPLSPPPLPNSVAASRGSRLPADWEPDQFCEDFARQRGLHPPDIAAQFRDYWHAAAGAKGRKTDWNATWRTWCRTEAERRSARSPPHRQTAQEARKARSDAIMAEQMRRIHDLENDAEPSAWNQGVLLQ